MKIVFNLYYCIHDELINVIPLNSGQLYLHSKVNVPNRGDIVTSYISRQNLSHSLYICRINLVTSNMVGSISGYPKFITCGLESLGFFYIEPRPKNFQQYKLWCEFVQGSTSNGNISQHIIHQVTHYLQNYRTLSQLSNTTNFTSFRVQSNQL